MLHHRSPNYHFLLTFGCLCYPYICPYNKHKMDFRPTPCIFVGYSSMIHDYRYMDIHSNKIYIARHVIFHKDSFPYLSISPLHHLSMKIHPGQAYPYQLSFISFQTHHLYLSLSWDPHLLHHFKLLKLLHSEILHLHQTKCEPLLISIQQQILFLLHHLHILLAKNP